MMKKKAKTWNAEAAPGFAFTYDNRSSMFTTKPLKLTKFNARNEPYDDDEVGVSHGGEFNCFIIIIYYCCNFVYLRMFF
jgi:hypothetical protein